MEAGASDTAGRGRRLTSDKYHRSADHESWVQRCPGCLPVTVRPHRCVAFSEVGGWTPRFWCLCDEEPCQVIQQAHAGQFQERVALVESMVARLAVQWEERDRD